MELSEIVALTINSAELIAKIQGEKLVGTDVIEKYKKQWDPKKHDVFDAIKRADKTLDTDSGPKLQAVTRLAIPLQKQIVKLAASFLCGNPITLNSLPDNDTEKDLLEVLKKSWKLNKLDYESKKLATIMMAETEVAELWFAEASGKGYWKGTPNDKPKVKLRLRTKILANSLGDTLYPVFNSFGDMIAFAREYSIKKNGKDEQRFDIYTEEWNYLHVNDGTAWVMNKSKNLFNKIPVIYYSQPQPEWHDVQEMIDRLETLVSNLADANDYSAFPIMFVQGELEGFATKGEQGKVIVGKAGATANWLTNNNAPESVKLEYTTLRSLIMDMSSSPDLSMEQMNSLGTYSGIALKMLFMAAHLKAAEKEENFGKSIQRRINFLKYALASYINTDLEAAVSMDIEPKFEYYLPKDVNEIITLLSTATGGASILSQKTAVGLNPLVQDAEKELKEIKENEAAAATNPNNL